MNLNIGYFADGPWGHETFKKLIKDPEIKISFICVRYDSKDETLYSSVYACLLSEILPGLKAKIAVCDDQWIDFFNAHQDSVSGYFLDSNISSRDFPESDWWGARHLALHVANAYASLGAVPKYRFHFLKQFSGTICVP